MLKKIREKLDRSRQAIDSKQHSEYVEAYLSDVVQMMMKGLEQGTIRLKGPEDFTDEEWQEMVRTATEMRIEQEEKHREWLEQLEKDKKLKE